MMKTVYSKSLFMTMGMLCTCTFSSCCWQQFSVEEWQKNQVPLFVAAKDNNLPEVKRLIEEGVDPCQIKNGNLLHAVARSQDPKMIEYVMSLGLDWRVLDDNGLTPLHRADTMMTKALLEHGADVNIQTSDGETPFYLTAHAWEIELPISKMELLLKHGANINEYHDKKTALDFWMADDTSSCGYYPSNKTLLPWKDKQKIMIPFLRERGAKTYQELEADHKVS